MKTVSKLICTAGLVGLAATASAQVYYFPGDLGLSKGSIPDGDINGMTLIDSVQNAPTSAIDINQFSVRLNIAGDPVGGTGDLYIYLQSPDGTIARLVNRPGLTGLNPLGYQDSYMNVVLFDGVEKSGALHMDIHTYENDPVYKSGDQTGVTGVFKADGRELDPLSSGAAFDAAGHTQGLSVFNGNTSVNGDWALFVADVSSGGNMVVKEWGIDFNPIPEPQSYAMVIGAGLAAFAFYRRRTR